MQSYWLFAVTCLEIEFVSGNHCPVLFKLYPTIMNPNNNNHEMN